MKLLVSRGSARAALVVCALLVPACGGVTTFQGRSGLVIVGDAPAAAPPPAPPSETGHAKIEGEQIVIDQKIQFVFDSAEISAASYAILDDVARVMRDHASITRVRVEGHASDEGLGEAANRYNFALSERRARSVMDYDRCPRDDPSPTQRPA